MKKIALSKKRKSIWICLMVLITALFITGTVFAEGELPAEETAGGTEEAQAGPEEEAGPTAEPQEANPEESEEAPPVEEEDSEEADQAGEESGSDEEEPSEEPPDKEELSEEPPAEDGAEEPAPPEDEAAENGDTEPPEGEEPVEEPGEDDEMSSGEEEGEDSESEEIDAEGEVKLVDEDGNPVDMASQESADLVSGSDPYWRVGRTYYSVVADEGSCYPGTSVAEETCWVSATPISTALEKIEEGRLPSDGNLYVEAGEYEETLNFSGTYLSQMRGLIGEGSSRTTIIGDINLDITKGFTLSGFTITGGVSVLNSSGSLTFHRPEHLESGWRWISREWNRW